MDAILANMTPREAPEFFRALELSERSGLLSEEEAVEWRRRLTAWAGFLVSTEEADEAAPLS